MLLGDSRKHLYTDMFVIYMMNHLMGANRLVMMYYRTVSDLV